MATSSAMRTIVAAGFESKEGEGAGPGDEEVEEREVQGSLDGMGFKISSNQPPPVVANRIDTELNTSGENVGSDILEPPQCSYEVSDGDVGPSNVVVDSNVIGTEMASSNTETDSNVTDTKMTDSERDTGKESQREISPGTSHDTKHKELESDFESDDSKSQSLSLEEPDFKDSKHDKNIMESTVHKIPLELNSTEFKHLEQESNHRGGNRSRIISVDSESDHRDLNRSRVMSLVSESDKKRSDFQSNVRTNVTMFILLMSVVGCTAPAFLLYGIQFLYLEPEPVLFIVNMLVGRTFFNLLPVIDGIAIMRHREFRIASRKLSRVVREKLCDVHIL